MPTVPMQRQRTQQVLVANVVNGILRYRVEVWTESDGGDDESDDDDGNEVEEEEEEEEEEEDEEEAVGGAGAGDAAAETPETLFVPIVEEGVGAGNVCCIGACCRDAPRLTWLRCCGNIEACIECMTEHVQRSRGWACPICRGDLRVYG